MKNFAKWMLKFQRVKNYVCGRCDEQKWYIFIYSSCIRPYICNSKLEMDLKTLWRQRNIKLMAQGPWMHSVRIISRSVSCGCFLCCTFFSWFPDFSLFNFPSCLERCFMYGMMEETKCSACTKYVYRLIIKYKPYFEPFIYIISWTSMSP